VKKISWLLVFGILLILGTMGCNADGKNSTKEPTEIMVSAAASLKNSLTEIEKIYEAKNPEVNLTISYASSGTLQQQIEQGAPADLFVSAGKKQMDDLETKNLLVKESRIDLLGNELVLVTGKDNDKITSLDDLTKLGEAQIGIGTPESVPAGKYAQEALMNLKLWDTLEPKLVQAKDVTAVLNYVETGNTEVGFVYRSDSEGSTKVKVAAVVPASSHSPIVYPASIIAATKNKQLAEDFLTFLQQSPEAKQVFEKYGFKTLIK
jgi:molybdate transport system substrate-binding protein